MGRFSHAVALVLSMTAAVVAFGPAEAGAQEVGVRIAGTVSRDGRPVVGAVITLRTPSGTRLNARTADNGRFEFKDVQTGPQGQWTYTIRPQSRTLSFTPPQRTVTLNVDRRESLDNDFKATPLQTPGSGLPPDSVGQRELKDDSVGSAEIQRDAVGEEELKRNSVGSQEIQTDAVGSDELQDDSVGANEIQTNAVGADEVQANAIGEEELKRNSVGAQEIQSDAVGNEELQDDSVGTNEIQADAVGADELQNDSVGADEVQANAIGEEELKRNSVGAQEIQTDAVGNDELQDDSVGASELQADAVGADELQTGAVGSDEIQDGAIQRDDIAERAVCWDQLCDEVRAEIAGGGGAALGQDVVGAEQLQANSVGQSELQSGSVETDAIQDGSIAAQDLADGAVGWDQLRTDVRTTIQGDAPLGDGVVGTDQLQANSVGPAALQSGSVGSDAIQDGSVGAQDLVLGSVGWDQLRDDVRTTIASGVPPLAGVVRVAKSGGDHTSIAGAVAAINPTQAQPVLIDVGPGEFDADVNLPSYVHVRGAGPRLTRLVGSAADGLVIHNQHVVRVSALTLEVSGTAISITDSSEVELTDCAITGALLGIRCRDSVDVEVTGCTIRSPQVGILCDSTSLRLSTTRLTGANDAALSVRGSRKCVVLFNEFSGNAESIDVGSSPGGSPDLQVSHNVIDAWDSADGTHAQAYGGLFNAAPDVKPGQAAAAPGTQSVEDQLAALEARLRRLERGRE